MIRHVYIERRMTPPQPVFGEGHRRRTRPCGDGIRATRIKELAAANIFRRHAVQNFAVTRLNRVVFYDYDEIEYMTTAISATCLRPAAMDDDYGGEITTYVDKRDMFPEQWRPFLTGDPRSGPPLLKHHPDLSNPGFGSGARAHSRRPPGDVFPYPRAPLRHRYGIQNPTSQRRKP